MFGINKIIILLAILILSILYWATTNVCRYNFALEKRTDQLKVVTKEKIETNTYESILFGWSVLKYVKSNAILIVKDCTTIGVGAGQVSRIDSVDIAITKSKGNTDRSILLSDAFFPFRDSIDKIANTGIKTIVQPGGSVRDQDVIDACNEHSLAMAFTGARCFKH